MRHIISSFALASAVAEAYRPSSLDTKASFCLNDIARVLSPERPQISLASISAFDPSEEIRRDTWIRLPQSKWAFPPVCAPDQHGKEPYCTFTSHSFASGRGISFVTVPSIAAAALELPAFAEPQRLKNVNKEDLSPPFEQRYIPGKGVGVIANKTLYRGDRIFAHTPVLVLHAGLYNRSHINTHDRQRMSKLALDQLPEGRRQLFYDLMGHFGGNVIDDRIDTNTFEIEINGVGHFAVFPETSRLNHDCRPNSLYFFDDATLTHYVHAVDTIQPGTELSITYIDPRQPRAKRVTNLHTSWGFHCGCSLCTQASAMTKESDSRLEQIEELIRILEDWDPEKEVDPSAGDLLISLFEQERLWVGRAEAYRLAAKAWNAVGEKWKAIKYARLAVELGTLDEGPRDRTTSLMVQMSEYPEEHWSWMRRARRSRNWIYNGY